MMISTKGRYALRVLINMAERQTTVYVPLKEIAAQQDISEKYLESILKVLVQNRLLEGLRGKGGGYRLTRPPEQYTVGEILRLTEGNFSTVACLEPGSGQCSRMGQCRTLPVWRNLDKIVNEYLDSVTIADLMRRDAEGRKVWQMQEAKAGRSISSIHLPMRKNMQKNIRKKRLYSYL